MNSWYDPRIDEVIEFEPPIIELEVDDTPPVVLLGPDDEVLSEIRRPFGFAPPKRGSNG